MIKSNQKTPSPVQPFPREKSDHHGVHPSILHPQSSTLNPQSSTLNLPPFILLVLIFPPSLHAAAISEFFDAGWFEQAVRFVSLRDPSVRYALAGSCLLGIACGLLGGYVVVRRMALLGDALSHAVLPGVALGFLWSMSKDPFAILVGATVAGLVGTWTIGMITRHTKIKNDAALGLVLAGFFAVGSCLLTMIQRLPTGAKSGIDKFLFGQAAALGPDDIRIMAVIACFTVIGVVLFHKELLVTSFDVDFARLAGFPVRWLNHALMLFLAFAVVISLQAVGVVLVSAMLITPAAAAYLLTDRMHRLLFLSAAIGVGSGAVGAFTSFLGGGLPTGPFMVLAAGAVFMVVYFLAPRRGVLVLWMRRRSRAAAIERENSLKDMYRVLENRRFAGDGVTLAEMAESRSQTVVETIPRVQALVKSGDSTRAGDKVYFTMKGRKRAEEIVRNHRLWELYLTESARIAPDHVHEDAEKIEHVLDDQTVRRLEKRLAHARRDPHGRTIPEIAGERIEDGE